MPTISVITAIYNGGHHYLEDTYRSLCEQQLPQGWSWQWCIQEDGATGIANRHLPASDDRISSGTGLSARTGVARTMALSRANGTFIRTLDADDMLLPGALARDIERLQRSPWCTSACLDLLADGSTVAGPYDPVDGPLQQRKFLHEHAANQMSVQAVTLAAHTDLVRALGGWPALTGAETDGLLLAVEAVAAGEFIASPSLIYRKHAGQTTASSGYWAPDEIDTRFTAVQQRARALYSSGWQWTGTVRSTSPPAHQAAS